MKTKKRRIIAFCGFEQSGKSYSCSRLVMTKGFETFAYADALRDIAFKIIGIPFEEGIKQYNELKRTDLINGLTFRNILENLGSGIRKYDKNFWARAVLTKIKNSTKNICISDLRYTNEYEVLKEFSEDNDIDFKLVFCDYHSEFYNDKNPHESAALAKFLKALGYEDQEYVSDDDIKMFEIIEDSIKEKQANGTK